ncbi:DnaJ domain-containing protein [Rhizobium sp. XQZ8]|uniref:DnaJ C-terminal domain-containing protein n=1 Tax=Rhizobium populisoli TaxID=2859785 RepID=UPI001CA5F271|nr:DnaJ C-terminal domain-containing protein [Rhizobium populisoli]MBW6421001.1 DnaJ domain-containing protein [Rhizobium populisoli]
MRDPYSVLGVKKNADPDEIKAAWRTKAKTVHPDHNQGDPSATSRFAEIGQAYEVLKDPARRKRYDQAAEMQQTIMQQRNAQREAAERAKAAKANAEKVMEELARTEAQRAQSQGQARQGQAQQGQAQQNQAQPGQAQQNQAKPGQPQNQSAGVETPEDVIERIFGAEGREQNRANTSSAQPAADETADAAKAEQNGERPPLPAKAVELIASLMRRFRGTAPMPEKAPDLSVDAPVTIEDLMKQNSITVKFADEREVRFPIEKGMTDGHVVRLKGQGLKINGMKQGDLNITLKLARDSRYRVDGFDLHVDLPISLQDAVLGSEMTVETPDGNRAVTVPAWSGSDQTVRLEGLGLPNGAGGRGDLVVELRIILWEKPDEKVTDLMRHMRHGLYV